MLKMDDGVEVLQHMRRVLWLFIKIGGRQCSEYIRGMLTHINVMAHLERVAHPVWTMWKTNVSAFNEEAGELAFSVLARMTNANASRSDLKLANAKFRLIRTQLTTGDDLHCDLSRHQQGSGHHHQKIKADSPDVIATSAHFLQAIRQMVANKFRVASDELVPHFVSNHQVPAHLQHVVGANNPTWIKDAKTAAAQLSGLTTKTMVATESNFLNKLMHVWDPDAPQFQVPNEDEEAALSSDEHQSSAVSANEHSDFGMLSDEVALQVSDSEVDLVDQVPFQPLAALPGVVLAAEIAANKRAALVAKQGPPLFNGGNRKARKDGSRVQGVQNQPKLVGGNAPPKSKRDRVGASKKPHKAKASKKARKQQQSSHQTPSSEGEMSCEELDPPPAKPKRKKAAVSKACSSSDRLDSVASNNIIGSNVEQSSNRRNQPRAKRQKVPFDDGGGDAGFEDFYGTADEEAQGLFESSD